MIRCMPVESAPMYNQNSLFTKKIQCKLFIIIYIKLFHIQFRENVECRLWFFCCYSRNIIQKFVDTFSLIINSSTWNQVFFHALITAQCCLNNSLCRHIGTKTHIGKHLKAFNISCCRFFITAKYHPSHTKSCNHMRFGKSTESYTKYIFRSYGRNRYMLQPIHNQSVVYFIRENDQSELFSQLYNLFKNFSRIQSTRWVIRINNNDGFCFIRNLTSHIFNIRIPVRFFVTDIMYRFSTCQRSCRSPKRIIRSRDQYFISII